MIDRGDGPLRPSHLPPCQPQGLESLRAGHFVDEVQVDIEDRLLAAFGVDDVVVPDFLEHCPGKRGHGMISNLRSEILDLEERIGKTLALRAGYWSRIADY